MPFVPFPSLFTDLSIIVTSIIVNVVPAFAPPTWLVLSLYKINHPYINLLSLAILGVVGSVIGRYIMYRYSELFGKYVPKKQADNLKYFKKLVGGNDLEVFFGALLYSLSPLPSNFLFISFGLSEMKATPVFLGFALGRLVSYTFLIDASFRSFSYFSVFFGVNELRYAIDILGVVFAVFIIFVRWKNVYARSHELKKKLISLFKGK